MQALLACVYACVCIEVVGTFAGVSARVWFEIRLESMEVVQTAERVWQRPIECGDEWNYHCAVVRGGLVVGGED